MTFKIINKYLQENNRTFVAIRQEAPYTAFDRVLIGDRVNESDEELIKAVIGQVTTEFNPADGVKKLQEDLRTQAENYEEKLAEAKNAAKEIFVKQIESSDARNVILSSQKSGAIAQMDNNVRALVFSDEHGNLAEKIKTMKNSEEGRLEQDAKKYNHKKSSK